MAYRENELMAFYNEPAFWTFLATTFGGLFGIIKYYFVHKDRSLEKRKDADMDVEKYKDGNLQKNISALNDFQSRMEPMILRHEGTMKSLEQAVQVVGIIEKGLNAMSGDLVKKYDEFQRKLVNVTTSFQITIDKVDNIEKKISNLGKVTYKP